MPSPQIENHYIKKALRGDMEAFGKVYFAFRGSIYGFAYRMLRESWMAEDVTQEVFRSLLENPQRFNPGRGELLAFLCGIARNKIAEYLRKHSTRFEVLEDDLNKYDYLENPEQRNGPLIMLLNEELTEKIEEKIAELPPPMREVLILREIEGLPYTEIARITETSLDQAKVRLYRARKRLAGELKPYIEDRETKGYEMY